MASIAHQLDLGVLVAPKGGSLEDAPLLSISEIVKCSGHMVVVDLETTGLNWWRHSIIGVAFWCPAAEVKGYVPTYDQADIDAVRAAILAWSPETIVINHNIKFDLHMLGIDPLAAGWRFYDTMVMAHIYDSRGAPDANGLWSNPKEERGSLNLGKLAAHYLGDRAKIEYQSMMKGKQHHTWPLRIISRYATDDARSTYDLALFFGKRLNQRGQADLVELAMRYLGVLWRTERRGLHVDRTYLLQTRQHLTQQVKQRETELMDIFRHLGHPTFDWRSSQQLSRALYDWYGWPRPSIHAYPIGMAITKTATAEDVLMKLSKHPLASHVTKMRSCDKMRGYVDKWIELLDANNFLHTTFWQTSARTARLASSDPNLQQIPSDRNELVEHDWFDDQEALDEFLEYTNMRRTFRAEDGLTYVGCDYAQQEIRMFAKLSNDPSMLAAVNSADIHSEMAFQIWQERDDPWRSWAKTITLGRLYGMGLEKAETIMGFQSAQIMAEYDRRFPGIKRFSRKVVEKMEQQGYVTYWSGRRYYRDDERGYYKAVNALVQGGAADLLMHAAVDMHDWIEREGLPMRIVNYVHDEVDFEIDTHAVAELAPQIAERMQMPHLLGIPFLAEMKAGPTLGDLVKL